MNKNGMFQLKLLQNVKSQQKNHEFISTKVVNSQIHGLDNSRIFPIRSLSLPRYFQAIW